MSIDKNLGPCGCCGAETPDCCTEVALHPEWIPKVCVCLRCPKLVWVESSPGVFVPVFAADPDADPVCVTLVQQFSDYPTNTVALSQWGATADPSAGWGPFHAPVVLCGGGPTRVPWFVAMDNRRVGDLLFCPGDPDAFGDPVYPDPLAYPYPWGGAAGDVGDPPTFDGQPVIELDVPDVTADLPCPYGTPDPMTGKLPDGILLASGEGLYGGTEPTGFHVGVWTGECPGGGPPGVFGRVRAGKFVPLAPPCKHLARTPLPTTRVRELGLWPGLSWRECGAGYPPVSCRSKTCGPGCPGYAAPQSPSGGDP
jgi:hypothetical protein